MSLLVNYMYICLFLQVKPNIFGNITNKILLFTLDKMVEIREETQAEDEQRQHGSQQSQQDEQNTGTTGTSSAGNNSQRKTPMVNYLHTYNHNVSNHT
jgi:hypothetical protein